MLPTIVNYGVDLFLSWIHITYDIPPWTRTLILVYHSLVGVFWCDYEDTTLLPTILMCQCVPIFRVSIGVEKVKTKEGTQALPI